MADKRLIEGVLRDHADGLMAVPGVVGVAQGECDGEPCISVLIVEESADLLAQIPGEIEGHLVAVAVAGEINALDAE